MNDDAFCEAVAEKAVQEHAKVMAKVTPNISSGSVGGTNVVTWVKTILAWLAASGVTWTMILGNIQTIVSIIWNAGGNWQAVIAAIMAIFFPITPPTVAAPAQP